MKKIIKKIIDKQTLTLIIGGLIINALCFFIYALPVKASGGNNVNSAYFPMHQNANGKFSDALLTNIDSRLDAENNYIFVKYSGYNGNAGYGTHYYNFVYFPKTSTGFMYAELFSNGYQFSLYSAGTTNFVQGVFWNDNRDRSAINGLAGNGNFAQWMSNMDSNIYNTSVDYVSNFRIYTNNTDTRKVVLNYGSGPEIQYGHATPPDEFDNPLTSNNQTLPREVPQAPTYNSYTWNTYNPPAFDNSSVLNAIESLGNKLEYVFEYLKDGIHGEIYTLNGNIKAYFEYIGETIQYYGGLIISNIQNLITTFYNNMVSLVEDIAGKITEFAETLTTIYDFIAHPLDTSVLNTQLSNSTFVSAVRTTKTQISTFNGMFSNITQPENVVFTIDLSGLWFDGGVSYLDFSILNPVLPFIRLVLGCMLLYDFIVTIFTNINSYIGGNSAKNDGG